MPVLSRVAVETCRTVLVLLKYRPKVILSLDFASCYTCVCLLQLATGMCVKCFGLGL